MYFENNKNIFGSEVDEPSNDRKNIFSIASSAKYHIYNTDKLEKERISLLSSILF